MGQATHEVTKDDIAGTREHLGRDVDALYDKVSPGRIVERRTAAFRDRLSSAKSSVMGSTHDAAGTAQDAAHGAAGAVSGAASDAVGTVKSQTQGAPLGAGLVAFGAGMVISALVPATPVERKAARGVTEAVKDSPVLDEAKAAAQEVGSNLKETATEAVQEVKSSAQDSAQTVKDEGQSAAQTVKEEAPGT